MKKSIFITAASLCLLLTACNDGNKKELLSNDVTAQEAKNKNIEETVSDQTTLNAVEPLPIGEQQDTATATRTTKLPPKLPVNADWEKKIIKTASMTLEVPDFKKYSNTIYKTVKDIGGYIAQEDQNLTAEKNETVISIKVPVYQFETMMNELPGTDSKVIERKITTDDVTGKMVDTKSRLEAKKEMRLKYLEFLKQSKDMKEVLQVQAEINNIQEQIESASSQVNYLSHQSAMSTINLTFYQLIAGFKPEPIEEPSFLTKLSRAFKSGGLWLADIFVGLVSVWPLLLIILASAIILRRIRANRKLTPIASPTEKK